MDGDRDDNHGVYFPSRVLSVKTGLLNVHMHSENGVQMAATVVVDLPGPGRGMLYGRFTVRLRADPVPGYRTTTLLWPDSERWPEDGHIEFPTGDLVKPPHTWVGYAQPEGGGEGVDTSARFSDWHTATTEWSPGEVKFILDDQVIDVVETTKVPSTPHYMVIQTQTCQCSATTSSGDLQVDWVAVYAPA